MAEPPGRRRRRRARCSQNSSAIDHPALAGIVWAKKLEVPIAASCFEATRAASDKRASSTIPQDQAGIVLGATFNQQRDDD